MKLLSLLMTVALAADTLGARIGKEAPDFEAESVVDGDFQKVSFFFYVCTLDPHFLTIWNFFLMGNL